MTDLAPNPYTLSSQVNLRGGEKRLLVSPRYGSSRSHLMPQSPGPQQSMRLDSGLLQHAVGIRHTYYGTYKCVIAPCGDQGNRASVTSLKPVDCPRCISRGLGQ